MYLPSELSQDRDAPQQEMCNCITTLDPVRSHTCRKLMSLDRTADQDVMKLGLRCLSSKMRWIMRSSGAHLRYWSGSSSMALTYAWKMSDALSLGRPSTIWSNTLTNPRAKTCSPSRCETTRGCAMCTVRWQRQPV